MVKQGSVAPRERVNIVYKPAYRQRVARKRASLKLVVMGDFTQREDDRMVEDRDPIGVDKDNFNDVLSAQNLSLKINVDDKLSDEDGNKLCVDIAFDGMSDFSPDRIVQQVPNSKKLLQLRDSSKPSKVRFPIFPSFASKFSWNSRFGYPRQIA